MKIKLIIILAYITFTLAIPLQVTATVPSPTLPPLTDGAYHWSFDTGLDGAAEVSTGANNTQVNTSARGNVPLATGRVGNAAQFTGDSGLLLGEDIITGDTYTIAFWANPSVITDWSSMFVGGTAARHVSITTRIGWANSTGVITVPPRQYHFMQGTIPANTWSHIAFTSNPARSSLYINGRRVYTIDNPADIFGGPGGSRFFLGVNYWDAAFQGLIDEVYIFPERALHVDEIREIAGLAMEFDASDYIMPGANTDFDDPPAPVFADVTVHDPSLTRQRAPDGYFYIMGTFLGAARSRDLLQWEAINDGDPLVNNAGRHWGFPVDNPDPAVETMAQQIYYNGSIPTGRNTVTFWASELIEMPCGRFFQYYTLSGGLGETDRPGPLGSLGVAIADTVDGPFVTQGRFIRCGYANRFDGDTLVPWYAPGENRAMWGDPMPLPFDGRIHANSIDPSPFFCENGDFWLVYGSYSGGIFLLEMCKETGLPIPYEESALNRENDGYGRLLIALTHHSGEGPHILYSEESDYYYLFLTFGFLDATGGYNVRVFRSRNPYGPYEDARFRQMHEQVNPLMQGAGTRWRDVDDTTFTHNIMGSRIIAGTHFRATPAEAHGGQGHLSPGHGGAIAYEGRYLKVFHTRFVGRGEGHQIRVHEMFINDNGWPLVAPLRFDGGEGARRFTAESLVGDYKIARLGRTNTQVSIASHLHRFEPDGTITHAASGETVGSWHLSRENTAHITLDGITYNGVFLRQYDADQQAWVQTFSVFSYDEENPHGEASTAGLTLWGVGVSAGLPFTGAVSDGVYVTNGDIPVLFWVVMGAAGALIVAGGITLILRKRRILTPAPY